MVDAKSVCPIQATVCRDPAREVTDNQTSQAVPNRNTTVRDGELPELV